MTQTASCVKVTRPVSLSILMLWLSTTSFTMIGILARRGNFFDLSILWIDSEFSFWVERAPGVAAGGWPKS